MSDLHLNFGAQPHELPGDDDAREARHQVLATLLGAYADAELPPETASQIDAHLLGCARCRREVELHTVVRARLAREPGAVVGETLRDTIRLAIANTALPATHEPPAARAWWRAAGVRVAGVTALLAMALATTLVARTRHHTSTPARTASAPVDIATVPLLATVLDDYRRVTAGDLPGRARDLDAVRAAVPFAVQPLDGSEASLLAAWNTDLRGEPAAVLAYRWHDRIVLQYLVAEPVFFRHPGIRAPIAAGRLVTAASGAQSLLAWPAPHSGTILVGDMPADALMALRVVDATR